MPWEHFRAKGCSDKRGRLEALSAPMPLSGFRPPGGGTKNDPATGLPAGSHSSVGIATIQPFNLITAFIASFFRKTENGRVGNIRPDRQGEVSVLERPRFGRARPYQKFYQATA